MKILALETSSQAASCAYMDDGRLVGEWYCNTGLTHSQTVMPMVESMLQSTGCGIDEMDVFAVSTGPGSFTGLRIGLSAVKGMAMALDKPCAGVSTLYGLAWNVVPFSGIIVPVLDARCKQVYTALLRSDGRRLEYLRDDDALALEDLKDILVHMKGDKLLVGDGAALCMEAFADVPGVQMAPAHLRYQRASSVCMAALELMEEGRLVFAAEIAPAYLRLPQAERELRKKQSEEKNGQ
ncbi:tRNA (adenosine(37)-N6)-threonylcarbamoyltransferase complex dimerization subunit type 1 TsaB [Ruminococcaceae bacterium OttesenSCG-928-L11]|nr:tRNA (adenosine(37)-N6)-threonylcarbamoyltransferase complex dimerization subunit type 1 TsaB [Ruminococcaceae bacterium OttesenSCG-928-L11]